MPLMRRLERSIPLVVFVVLAGGVIVALAASRATTGESGVDQQGMQQPARAPEPDGGRDERPVEPSPTSQPNSGGVTCGEVKTTDDAGSEIRPAIYGVTRVHDAACTGDFDALEDLMDAQFSFRPPGYEPGDTASPREVVSRWRRLSAEGQPILRELAAVLEVTPPAVYQGGLLYENETAIALFSRGATAARLPSGWVGFWIKP
jgi:hypothetical protein